jgi:Acetoacetate decarboxylase (ADC)
MRRLILAIFTCSLLAAGLALVACSSKTIVESHSIPLTGVPTASTASPTKAATQERQWAFRGQRGVTAAWAPTDLALYRSLLPTQFDMPESPLVAVAVVNYYDVTLPLTPYSEGYVVLQCRYQGRTGWYVLTMPVDDQVANDGGRFLGFPKYVADRIELVESEGGWSGRVEYRGSDVMGVTFTPSSQPPTDKSSDDPGLPVFLLQPPAEGPTVNEVDMVLFGPKRTVSTTGSAVVEAGSSEAWAGLLPAGGAISYATFDEQTGEWILSGTPQ